MTLQKKGNYYLAALQSEKNDSSKILKENEKEIRDLRERLREVDELREQLREVGRLREKLEKDVNALERKLDSRNKQIFDYKNKIKSHEENSEPIVVDFNERYNLLENKLNESEEDNNLLRSRLQASEENYRDIYQTFEWMLEELARIDSDIMDREILDSKENPILFD